MHFSFPFDKLFFSHKNNETRQWKDCIEDFTFFLFIFLNNKNNRQCNKFGGLTRCVAALFPEEAVNDVKRQAVSELQKAVSEAERKAHEMISSERAKMERTVAEVKRQAAEDALSVINQQEDSSEVRTRSAATRSIA